MVFSVFTCQSTDSDSSVAMICVDVDDMLFVVFMLTS